MAGRWSGVVWIAVLACGTTRGTEIEPYTCTVAGKGVSVRSGPGLKYYATDFLQPGDPVDVYAHRGEWAAIRPPEGSFSWVPAEQVGIATDPRIGIVRGIDVTCRVGTRYSRSHTAEFVRLNKGESVSILGRAELPEANGQTRVWYKIAPPAGEFRWVPRESLQTAEAPPGNASEGGWMIVDDRKATPPSAVSQDVATVAFDADPHAVEAANAVESAPATTTQRQRSLDSPEPQSTSVPSAAGAPLDSLLPDPPTAVPSASPSGPIRPEVLTDELLGVELKLTETVVREPVDWELAPLRARVQTIIDLSPNAELRADAHRMLAKIAQFEDLQRRHVQLTASQAAAAQSRPRSIADLLGSTVTAAGLSAATDQRGDYAGTGWLMPLVTRRDGVPRYALTDQDGNIIQFVSPAPGINLNPYAKKRIGIYGQRGFIPDLNKPHLMAERIVTLDRVR